MKNFIKPWKEKKLLAYVIATLLMLVSVGLSLKSYKDTTNFLGFFSKTIKIVPTLISTMIAIIIYSAVIIRNFKKYYSDIPKLVISVINILFLASFLSVFLTEKATIFGLDTRAILIAGVLLSWLGIRTISGYIWIVLVLLGTTRISSVDKAMGVYGAIYILCAYLSIIVQVVFCKMFTTDFETLKEDIFGIKECANKDVKIASDQTKSTIDSISNFIR